MKRPSGPVEEEGQEERSTVGPIEGPIQQQPAISLFILSLKHTNSDSPNRMLYMLRDLCQRDIWQKKSTEKGGKRSNLCIVC